MNKKNVWIFPLVVLSMAALACNLLSQAANPSAPNSTQPTEVMATANPVQGGVPTVAASGNPLDLFNKVTGALTQVKSYRVKVNVTGGTPGPTDNVTLEVVAPDRIHMTSPIAEVITISNTIYIKQGGSDSWIKMGGIDLGSSLVSTYLIDPRKLVAKALTTKNVTFSGADTINGKPMFVFQYTPSATDNTNDGPGKMWVGATDGLPYKVVSTDKDGKTVTLDIYDYNADISIEPPIP